MPAAITFFHGNFFGQCLPMVAVYLLWSVFTYGGCCNSAKRKKVLDTGNTMVGGKETL